MRVFKLWVMSVWLITGLVPRTGLADDIGPLFPESAVTELLERARSEKSVVKNRRYAALLNYRQPSWEPRFYLFEIDSGKRIASYVVAHGRGSDPDHDGFATQFSDESESHMSSLGFFLTGDTYYSESAGHGLSLRLNGLSETNQNSNARDIVIHGNWYVEKETLAMQRKPGRSYGCMVFSAADRDAVVEKLKDGALIYAVY